MLTQTHLQQLQLLWQQGEQFDASHSERREKRLNITPDTGKFLYQLSRSRRARTVLEIGTSNGFSTVWLALAAKAHKGRVFTIDVSAHKTALAHATLEAFGVSDVVDARTGDAFSLLADADVLDSPEAVSRYLRLTIGQQPVEVFYVVFLSAQNRVLAVEELSRGSLTETRVYPREVVQRALFHHAAAVIVAHNHPSGVAEPSAADLAITERLKQALQLVDIRLLDHIVVTGAHAESLAERGWV